MSTGHRVDRSRRSAKATIEQYANELMSRRGDMERDAKLLALETIASRMGWVDLFNRIKYRQKAEPIEHWWQK